MQAIEINTPSGTKVMRNNNNEQLAEAARRIYEQYGGNLQCFFNVILSEDASSDEVERFDKDSMKRMLSTEKNASETGTSRKS